MKESIAWHCLVIIIARNMLKAVETEIYTMKIVFFLELCAVFLGANAEYVRRLNGTIHLPMAGSLRCGSRSRCPKPVLSHNGPRRMFHREIYTMKEDWRRNEEYLLDSISFGRYNYTYTYKGSQTECDFNIDGTLNCMPQPVGFCYAFVYLGIRATHNSRIAIRISGRTDQEKIGTAAIQILSLGRQPKLVHVELECVNGEPCLKSQVALLNLLYRCA